MCRRGGGICIEETFDYFVRGFIEVLFNLCNSLSVWHFCTTFPYTS
jgi:hypothetical protein